MKDFKNTFQLGCNSCDDYEVRDYLNNNKGVGIMITVTLSEAEALALYGATCTHSVIYNDDADEKKNIKEVGKKILDAILHNNNNPMREINK